MSVCVVCYLRISRKQKVLFRVWQVEGELSSSVTMTIAGIQAKIRRCNGAPVWLSKRFTVDSPDSRFLVSHKLAPLLLYAVSSLPYTTKGAGYQCRLTSHNISILHESNCLDAHACNIDLHLPTSA